LHLGGTLKTVNKPAFFETSVSTSLNDRLALNNKLDTRSKELIALQNYPNPFNEATIIDYQIWQSFNQAELRITNVLGQVLHTQKLQKPIDKVEINGSNLANGLYYYSIVVDNSVKLTKTMSVMH
jgi:calcineurin-like phosphoesterase